ncbi:putative AC transposase, partial [Pseudolycoriella hygida]
DRIPIDAQPSTSKAKKTRAVVYQFFEWDDATSRYRCPLYGKQYSMPKYGGTGSLNNHMNRNHKSAFDNEKVTKNDSIAARNGSIVTLQRPIEVTADIFATQMKNYQKASLDDVLKVYLAENVVDSEMLVKEKSGIDGALGWWKIHQKEYPTLAKVAKDFLPVSGIGVPVESLFSSGGDVMSARQQSMAAETIRMRICSQAWLKKKKSFNDDILRAIARKFGINDEIQSDDLDISEI